MPLGFPNCSNPASEYAWDGDKFQEMKIGCFSRRGNQMSTSIERLQLERKSTINDS